MSEHKLPEIIEMTADAYHLAGGVSKSMLDQLAHPKTPAHLRAYLDEPRPEPSDAMEFGSALHSALLQPDTMSKYAIRPEGLDMRTKTGKEWAEANSDRPVLTKPRAVIIERCVANCWAHPVAKRLLKDADFERSLFASDSHGTLRKGRLDALPRAGNIIPDVKTCASAAPDDFEKSVADYRYMVQAAYYLDLAELCGIERSHFLFICVEKTPPYAVAVHELDPMVIEYGRKLYQRDLTVYRQCVETGVWPGYPQTVQVIGVPKWLQREVEAMA